MTYRIPRTAYEFNKWLIEFVQQRSKFRKCIIESGVLLKEQCKSPIELSKPVIVFDKWGIPFVQQITEFDKCMIISIELVSPLDNLVDLFLNKAVNIANIPVTWLYKLTCQV